MRPYFELPRCFREQGNLRPACLKLFSIDVTVKRQKLEPVAFHWSVFSGSWGRRVPGVGEQVLPGPWRGGRGQHHEGDLDQELQRRHPGDHPADAVPQQGLPAQHPQLGLEARRRRHLSRRAQARLHRTVLSCARVQHHDGKPLCYALIHHQPRHGSVAEWLLTSKNNIVTEQLQHCPGDGLRDVHRNALSKLFRNDLQPGVRVSFNSNLITTSALLATLCRLNDQLLFQWRHWPDVFNIARELIKILSGFALSNWNFYCLPLRLEKSMCTGQPFLWWCVFN